MSTKEVLWSLFSGLFFSALFFLAGVATYLIVDHIMVSNYIAQQEEHWCSGGSEVKVFDPVTKEHTGTVCIKPEPK